MILSIRVSSEEFKNFSRKNKNSKTFAINIKCAVLNDEMLIERNVNCKPRLNYLCTDLRAKVSLRHNNMCIQPLLYKFLTICVVHLAQFSY